jgi:hypothetical protein
MGDLGEAQRGGWRREFNEIGGEFGKDSRESCGRFMHPNTKP